MLNQVAGPMEQFVVKPLSWVPTLNLGGYDLTLTNAGLWMLIAVAGVTLFLSLGMARGALVPGRFQSMAEMAYEFIANPKIREALDVQREPLAIREKYGMTVLGQASLAARRLVEGGSKFVTVFWDEFGLAGSGWDTHWEHYPRMKNELMPGFDMAFSGLVDDLDQRGMLDETLVVVLSEHGRTPKMNNAKGGGRDHWSQAYSAMFAGGGTARGKVVGKTDSIGGTVKDRPVSPKDLLATIYHLLGIDLETHLVDRTQRPQILVPDAQVVPEMLA